MALSFRLLRLRVREHVCVALDMLLAARPHDVSYRSVTERCEWPRVPQRSLWATHSDAPWQRHERAQWRAASGERERSDLN
eukprot:6206423-Pleurochrysis_carterae.AAC.3